MPEPDLHTVAGAPPGTVPGRVRPAVEPMQPIMVSDVMIAGGVDDNDPIVVFQFLGAPGQIPPIMLRTSALRELPVTVEDAVDRALELAGQGPEIPVVLCSGPCGRRIYGPVADKGICGDCEKATAKAPTQGEDGS